MIIEYINEALKKAKYEIINDEEPYYGEIPEIKGVWATGKSLEECRQQLRETLDEWLILSFKKNLPIPDIRGWQIFPGNSGRKLIERRIYLPRIFSPNYSSIYR